MHNTSDSTHQQLLAQIDNMGSFGIPELQSLLPTTYLHVSQPHRLNGTVVQAPC